MSDTLDDGFGNVWAKCEREDCALEIVRPGKAQCARCSYENVQAWTRPLPREDVMSALIGRVARKAGWIFTFDAYDASSPYVSVGNDRTYVERGELTPAGLVILLKELLLAKWTLDQRGTFVWWDSDGNPIQADTLEQATLLAYDAHKGEP